MIEKADKAAADKEDIEKKYKLIITNLNLEITEFKNDIESL